MLRSVLGVDIRSAPSVSGPLTKLSPITIAPRMIKNTPVCVSPGKTLRMLRTATIKPIAATTIPAKRFIISSLKFGHL